jgi:hypothetical protein
MSLRASEASVEIPHSERAKGVSYIASALHASQGQHAYCFHYSRVILDMIEFRKRGDFRALPKIEQQSQICREEIIPFPVIPFGCVVGQSYGSIQADAS